MKTYRELRSQFEQLGLPVEKPGFCNDPAFLAAEASYPDLLDDYARYVALRPVAGVDETRRAIIRAADFIHAALVRDGRTGACVDASCLLSEFLNRLDVWSFVRKGGASVYSTSLPPAHMAPVMVTANKASTGHAWVVAPPFSIVDLTIGLQPYSSALQSLVPRGEYLRVERARAATAELDDLVEREAIAEMRRDLGRQPLLRDLFRFAPSLEAKVEEYGAWEVGFGQLTIRYVGTATGGIADPLEEWNNIPLDGLRPIDFFGLFSRST